MKKPNQPIAFCIARASVKGAFFLFLAIGAIVALSGCVTDATGKQHFSPGGWYAAHGDQIQATGGYLAKKVAGIAVQSVLAAAVSSQDANNKADFLDSLALGVRTNGMANIATADDWRALAAIWTPDKPHWAELATDISDTLKTTGKVSPAKLEEVAKGLNLAAAETRAQDAAP